MERGNGMLARLWRTSPPLTAVGLLMLGAFAASLVGLWIDTGTITGAPAWLKPAKFGISTAVYSLTLAWVFTFLRAPRLRHVVGWTTAIVFVLEVAIIDVQAWRGVASHFNVATPLDAALFGVMGLGILVQTLTSIAVAVALWRQEFADASLGWALRFGMIVTIVGASTGGLMTRPTASQLAEARATHHMALSGAHTVGAPDGGPGLPGTGWSTNHGDLRVPHFVGLHALQALAVIAIALGRAGVRDRTRVRATLVATASYGALFALLLWQALRGQPLFAPDAISVSALAIWAVVTVAGVWIAARRGAVMLAHVATW